MPNHGDIQRIDRDIVAVLVPRILRTGSAITYGNLSSEIEKRFGYAVNPHTGFNFPLGRLQEVCKDLQLPCISVMVVNQQWKPGSGFVACYRDLYPEADSMTDEEIRLKQLNECKACKNWQRLFDFFGLGQLPCFGADSSEYEPVIYTEGGVIEKGATTAIERNAAARQKCLEINGTACVVCGFDSMAEYGVPGIIHVHHLNPLSWQDGDHEIDPSKDLVPVCPNCHMLIHSKMNDLMSIEEARKIVLMKKL